MAVHPGGKSELLGSRLAQECAGLSSLIEVLEAEDMDEDLAILGQCSDVAEWPSSVAQHLSGLRSLVAQSSWFAWC